MVLFDTHKLVDFKQDMYATLVYKHHVTTSNKKLEEFKDDKDGNPVAPLTGFRALKGDELFLLQGNIKDDLPIKIMNPDELPTRVNKSGDVVTIVPYNTEDTDYYVSFRIVPAKMVPYDELLAMSDQKHSTGNEFTLLYGNILYTAMCSRINVGIAGNVGSGKSSFIDCLNNIYDCMPRIEKPSTGPALAPGVSTDGVLAIDELSGLKTKEGKVGVETVINSLASGSNTISFGTAGSRAYRTQNPPPVNNLSCVIVYNLFGTQEACQKDLNKFPYKPSYFRRNDYFDWMWVNGASVVDRFLRMKMPDGKLDTAQFLNNGKLTDEETTQLKMMAKSVAYYREVAKKGFVVGVANQPPELDKDDVSYILKYIKEEMGISNTSRYLSSLLEILKFAMVASKKDKTRFAWYADNYKKWMEDYDDMINLRIPDDKDSFAAGVFKTQKVEKKEDKEDDYKISEVKMPPKNTAPLDSFSEDKVKKTQTFEDVMRMAEDIL